MIKKGVVILFLIIGIFMLSFMSFGQNEINLDLSLYPFPFIKDNEVNAIMVVGDNASYLDMVAANNLIISLGYNHYYVKGIDASDPEAPTLPYKYGKKTKLAKDILEISTRNIIAIGGPCANRITAEIMDLPISWPECITGFENAKGRILLYNKWNKSQLVVAGMSDLDTRKTEVAIRYYLDYNLTGKGVEVWGSSLEDIKVNILK